MPNLTTDAVINVLVIVCAVPALGYTFFYLFRPWTTTPQGRALMIKSWGNAILLGMAVAVVIWDDYPLRWLVRLIGFTAFSVGIWYLFIALLRSRGAKDYPPFTWCRAVRRLTRRTR